MEKYILGLIIILITSCNYDVSNTDSSTQNLDTIIAPYFSKSLALKDSILLPELLIRGSCNLTVKEGYSCHFTARLSDSTFYNFYDEHKDMTYTLYPIVKINDDEVDLNEESYSASKYVKIEPPYRTYSNSDKRYKEIKFEWVFPHPKGGDITMTKVITFELKNS